MTIRERLEEGLKLITCRQGDGSTLKFVTTLNKEELELRDLASDNFTTLVNLMTLEPIDSNWINSIVSVEEYTGQDIVYEEKVDDYLSKGIR